MLAQITLALPRALPARARRTRTTFRPGIPSRTYRLPQEIRDRLVAALEPYRNREAAYLLAAFLARFWSMPGRVALPFPIDRRALADRQDLQLTEARVRGAIRTLEAIGFLARAVRSGSRYKATEEGLRRKPIPFTFGSEYGPLFMAANRQAAAARGAVSRPARPQTARTAPRPSPVLPEPALKSPKGKSEAESLLLMGENLPRLSPAALRAIGIAEAKRGGRGK